MIKGKVESLPLPKSELFTGIRIGFCLQYRDITFDGCFSIHHVFSWISKQASITNNITLYQHHSYLNFFFALKPKVIHETNYSLCTLKKIYPTYRETTGKMKNICQSNVFSTVAGSKPVYFQWHIQNPVKHLR